MLRPHQDGGLQGGRRALRRSQPSIEASIKLTGKSEFDSIGEIKKLFVKKGVNTGGLNNMLTDVDDVDEESQFPLVFLQEFLNPDGKANTPTQYPIPRLLQRENLNSTHSFVLCLLSDRF